MNFIDLSHPFYSGMPAFPGTTVPEMRQSLSTDKGDICNVTQIAFNSHVGTHIDAPYHMIPEGASIDKMPADSFTGRAIVIDVREIKKNIIETTEIKPYEEKLQNYDFVLFLTGWSKYWNTSEYFGDFPVLSHEAARRMTSFHLKGIGFDCPSADRVDSAGVPIHKILLGSGMILIENLTGLEQLLNQQFHFFCLPLNILKGDGCPVRAVGVIEGTGI